MLMEHIFCGIDMNYIPKCQWKLAEGIPY